MFLFYLRTVIFYIVLIFVIRCMGKRQVGPMEPSEFVVTMLVANLASIPMEDRNIPIQYGLLPIAIVLGMEILMSWLSLKSIRLRKLLCGKPVILVENGNILQDNLRKTRVTLDELTGHLREKDVLDIASVQYAILETNGNLSVFPFPKDRPASAQEAGIKAKKQYLPFTLICDGKVIEDNLKLSGRDIAWLRHRLAEKKATVKSTWLFMVDEAGKETFYPKIEN